MTIRKKTTTKKDGPPIPLHDVELLPAIMAAMFYGRSGTGKTTLAASFPMPAVLLDIRERGTDSVSNVKGIQVGHITEWHQIEDMYWYLKEGKHHFKTVILDQLTQMQELAIAKVMKEAGKEKGDKVTRQDFGSVSTLMKDWILNYRDLIDSDINVVFLAHDRVSRGGDDDSGGEDQIEPSVGAALMPSIASYLNGAVKMIGNTFIREDYKIENKRKVRFVEFGLRIGPHAYYTTKTRSPVGIESPDVVVNPSYDKLVRVMQGNYSKAGEIVRKKR